MSGGGCIDDDGSGDSIGVDLDGLCSGDCGSYSRCGADGDSPCRAGYQCMFMLDSMQLFIWAQAGQNRLGCLPSFKRH